MCGCANKDLDYDAAVPIYVNRSYLVSYLHSRVFASDHKNILEDFLYQALLTSQFIAMSRANAIIDIRISRPHRWLAGKSGELQDWSPMKMNGVLVISLTPCFRVPEMMEVSCWTHL